MTNLHELDEDRLIEACGCMESALVGAILKLQAEGRDDIAATLKQQLDLAHEGIDFPDADEEATRAMTVEWLEKELARIKNGGKR